MIDYQFDWSVALGGGTLFALTSGLLVTISLALMSGILAIGVGLSVAMARYSEKNFLQKAAGTFVEIFRNIPALILILGLSFAFPQILPAELRRNLLFDNQLIDSIFAATGIHLFYYTALLLGLALNTAAYLAEIFRAGFESVSAIQVDAARASGLSKRLILRMIVVPQGLRISVPALATRLIHNLKNTALAIFVPVPDFFSALLSAISRTFRSIEILAVGIVFYLALAWATSVLLNYWTQRTQLDSAVTNGLS